MDIVIVQDRNEKRVFIEAIDSAFQRGLVGRENAEEIFDKIDKYAIFIGAYDEGQPVGYAAIYANDQDSQIAYITMIGVLTSKQGMHIGKALMDKCVDEARNQNMKCIRLEVYNSNKKAIDFYQHCGFEYEKKCSDDSNYYLKRI